MLAVAPPPESPRAKIKFEVATILLQLPFPPSGRVEDNPQTLGNPRVTEPADALDFLFKEEHSLTACCQASTSYSREQVPMN